mmetsp:Transcript_37052/g.64553  ORF Transcript_37052/g.64553 Transcript_37052/m.64553 type:complete len:262 (-) Transcript_37052:639-1424(-)
MTSRPPASSLPPLVVPSSAGSSSSSSSSPPAPRPSAASEGARAAAAAAAAASSPGVRPGAGGGGRPPGRGLRRRPRLLRAQHLGRPRHLQHQLAAAAAAASSSSSPGEGPPPPWAAAPPHFLRALVASFSTSPTRAKELKPTRRKKKRMFTFSTRSLFSLRPCATSASTNSSWPPSRAGMGSALTTARLMLTREAKDSSASSPSVSAISAPASMTPRGPEISPAEPAPVTSLTKFPKMYLHPSATSLAAYPAASAGLDSRT